MTAPTRIERQKHGTLRIAVMMNENEGMTLPVLYPDEARRMAEDVLRFLDEEGAPLPLDKPRPDDSFPNVAYVRYMIGRELTEEELDRARHFGIMQDA